MKSIRFAEAKWRGLLNFFRLYGSSRPTTGFIQRNLQTSFGRSGVENGEPERSRTIRNNYNVKLEKKGGRCYYGSVPTTIQACVCVCVWIVSFQFSIGNQRKSRIQAIWSKLLYSLLATLGIGFSHVRSVVGLLCSNFEISKQHETSPFSFRAHTHTMAIESTVLKDESVDCGGIQQQMHHFIVFIYVEWSNQMRLRESNGWRTECSECSDVCMAVPCGVWYMSNAFNDD